MTGVVNEEGELLVNTGAPPVGAVYQLTILPAFAEACRTTVPAPQRELSVVDMICGLLTVMVISDVVAVAPPLVQVTTAT